MLQQPLWCCKCTWIYLATNRRNMQAMHFQLTLGWAWNLIWFWRNVSGSMLSECFWCRSIKEAPASLLYVHFVYFFTELSQQIHESAGELNKRCRIPIGIVVPLQLDKWHPGGHLLFNVDPFLFHNLINWSIRGTLIKSIEIEKRHPLEFPHLSTIE